MDQYAEFKLVVHVN